MYHPTSRVLTVLELMQSRPGISGSELADRLETDIRSVRRYIAKLQDVGIPVEATPGRYGGYRLRPGYKLPPLIFNEEEATAVVLGLLGSSWLEIGQSQSAVDGALSKISRVMPKETWEKVRDLSKVIIYSPHRENAPPPIAVLFDLNEAVNATRCVAIDYGGKSGENSSRVVEPYGVVGREGKWYLVAYCRLRKDFRTFRLDRVTGYAVSDEVFKKDREFDYDRYVAERVGGYQGKWTVRLRFDAELRVLETRWPVKRGHFVEKDGAYHLELSTDDLELAARYLLLMRVPFAVLEPDELKHSLRTLAAECLHAAGSSC